MSLAPPPQTGASSSSERRGASPSPRASGHASPSVAAVDDFDRARRRSSSRHAGAEKPALTSRPITLWTHEPPNFSTQDIVLNPEILHPFGHLGEGDLLQVTFPPGASGRGATKHPSSSTSASSRNRHRASPSFVFKPSQGLPDAEAGPSSSTSSSSSQLQLSLSRGIANVYGFYNRAEVILSKVPKATNAISHVELYFRDQYVGRADMWRFTAQMEDTCVYVGQKITLSGSVRAHIGRIFIKERKVTSGYVAPDTKAIFRSESAKYQLFFQMGKEMWDFDEDGEIYYEKAISGFLPDLLQRWRDVPANHVISITLFARVLYDEDELSMVHDAALPVQREPRPNGRHYVDYYSVLVDLESNCNWADVMAMLKEQFFRFQHDILLIRRPIAGPAGAPWHEEEQHADLVRRDRALLAGRVSASHEGNILEAINLALNPFDEHYIDRDLNRTGFGFIFITAGTGHFRVDKKWLRMTTERMIDNGLGLDLVCLTKMPLHSVPLFHFESHLPSGDAQKRNTTTTTATQSGFPGPGMRNHAAAANATSLPPDPLYDDSYTTRLNNLHGKTAGNKPSHSAPSPTMQFYSIPHWVDASFYNLQQDQPFRADRFVPRVKMQEIQQIGYMENEISDISLPYLDLMRLATLPPMATPFTPGAGSKGLSGSGTGSMPGPPHSATSSTGARIDTSAPSKRQRKALRSRFDAETFRDLEKAPPPVKSGSLYALGSRRSGTSLSAAFGRREGSFDTLNERAGLVAPMGTGTDTLTNAASLQASPSNRSIGGRLGRDSLRVARPALESHAEDAADDDGNGDNDGDGDSSRVFDSPQWTPSLSATTSMQSLAAANNKRHSQGYFPPFSAESSRPASIRSVSTLFRPSGLRPLQPVGKAEAFVAPSQPEDLVEDLPVTTTTNDDAASAASPQRNNRRQSGATRSLHASPLNRQSSRDYLRVVSASASAHTPKKARINAAGWLWNSLTGGSATQPSTPSAAAAGNGHQSPVVAPSPAMPSSSSNASLRIKALLKGTPSTPASPTSSSSKTHGQHPHPISIPSQSQSEADAGGKHKGKSNGGNGGGDGSGGDGGDDDATPQQKQTQIQRDRQQNATSSPRTGNTPYKGSNDTIDTVTDSHFRQEQDAYEQALEDAEAKARYAQRAQVEKQTLVNPSNPRKNLNANTASHQMLRWQHLWPRRLNRHVVKWRSLTTPACLPLTTFYLPTEQELQDQWAEYPHTLSVSSEFSSFLVKRSTSTVPALAIMRELTAQRLAQGFQFIVPMGSRGDSEERSGGGGGSSGVLSSRRYGSRKQRSNFVLNHPSQLFQPGTLTSGNPILLGMSNQVHRVSYDRAAGAINVERYIRKMPYDVSPIEYNCCIWSRHTPGYRNVTATFKYPDFGSYAWTRLDSLVAGHSDEDKFSESMKYWRTRFVIVPSEARPPPMLAPTGEALDDEEIRLIGMDRLADAFARARWKGRNQISTARTQATALLRFIPTSLDPSMSMWDKEFMRQMQAAIVEDEQVEEVAESQRRAARKKNIKDSSLDAIAVALSSEKYGLRIEDRVWNRTFYASAFSGTDLTTWLFCEFTDVKTREEAIEWGSKLMKQGLFEHVHAVHGFLDGHYFYRFKPDWAKKIVGARKSGSNQQHSRNKSDSAASKSSNTNTDGSTKGAAGTAGADPRRLKMSRTLIIDVDPSGKSDRAETAFLHYDISHNPANGFNAQLHWLGTTSRFIDDAVQNWTRLVERHGLRLIEAPIGQICDVSKHNPFQTPTQIHLSLPPPAAATFAHLLPLHTNPNEYFEWRLLRKFGFVLDQEATHRYPSDVEIIYQSRPARFDHSQFVHRSGVAFVQVLGGEGGFLWLGNRLFNSHIGNRNKPDGNGGSGGGGVGHGRGRFGGSNANLGASKGSGIAAGLGGRKISGGTSKAGGNGIDPDEEGPPDPDRTRKEFTAFCGDPLALHAFYLDVLRDIQAMQGGEHGGEIAGTGTT